MVDVELIFAIVKIILSGISALIALLYCIPIIFLRRFHDTFNLLVLNLCSGVFFATGYYVGYFTVYHFYLYFFWTQPFCNFLYCILFIAVSEIPFGLVTLSLIRYCTIVHHTKGFFKTKIFLALCLVSQRIIECLLLLPFALPIGAYCSIPKWSFGYLLVSIILLPGLITLLLNLAIFKYVHSSSRRIQPINNTNQIPVASIQVPKLTRRDMNLLRQTIIIWGIVFIGCVPSFALIAIDYQGNVPRLVYSLLEIWDNLTVFAALINLFLYNSEVRIYIKNKLIGIFDFI
ncbi:unnamed protein product [Adineta steineri]|uniref:G-protein coupled receptors family 1 profile domain-containing protein n=1 Tax=Adineta steineri TaxID=433720 RepID=A0A818YB69_9BILA|nr:unnamed protein product [Adineta steineri]CAF0888326.1 unnamed protein product [Adineta steineri]CAF1020261.1 unnamed protein product [Adineta steineri]CAF3607923.1 unnamed protein product [Adineta steineri]CAF3750338.1 unnamed protein product [Adineta steineri]